MFRQRGIIVLFVIALYLIGVPYLPAKAPEFFYTVSLFIKDLLLWMLPMTVCFFISHAISSFEKKAPMFILTLFAFETISNLLNVWYAYGCGQIIASGLPAMQPYVADESFGPLWRLPLTKPEWWAASKGTYLGIILGLGARYSLIKHFVVAGKSIFEKLLTKIFARLIPIFILGFVARLEKTGVLTQIATQYTELLIWLVAILALYIATLFALGSGLKSAKNLFPAASVAFSSGCSISTMPWTIEGTAKNLKNPDLAKAVIPATTNIQQVGDCIANAFLCFLIYRHFFGHCPDLATWLPFSLVFVLARFATAAVIGGAIFIMLPIYESYLHFNPEMITMILAFNVILDPLITSTNVIGNGALCPIFERVWNRFQFGKVISSKG